MTFRKNRTSSLLETSEEAKHFWGKTIEDQLPKPTITEDPNQMMPSQLLLDILQYARGAESRGEWLFRHNYLKPIFDYYSTNNEGTSYVVDAMGNFHVQVGEKNGILHVGHIDTVHDDEHSPLQEITVSEQGIVTLDPIAKNSKPINKKGQRWVNDVDVGFHYTSYELPARLQRCLGADDGCAVAIMIYLIAHQVNGTYVFTRGEEIGCVGTKYIIENNLIEWSEYMVAIEVDRKGTTEIIGKMSPGRTASQSFVDSLAEQLGMGHTYSDKGSITDVGHMAKFIPECVNIAAGYNLQHSDRETTDIKYLDNLGAAMLTVVWEDLTVERGAGEYTVPVKHRAIPCYPVDNYVSRTPGTGYNAKTYANYNSYGDYGAEPEERLIKFADMFGQNSNKFAREGFVRSNAGLISEFLEALNLSPAEMHNFICFGNVEGVIDMDELEAESLSSIEEK